MADVAEVSEGRLMVATLDGEQEIVGGWIFGGYGRWKMWLEDSRMNHTDKYDARRPLTMPNETVHFRFTDDGENWEKRRSAGRIRRLKKPDLPNQ